MPRTILLAPLLAVALSACAPMPVKDNQLGLAPAGFRLAPPGTEIVWENRKTGDTNAIRVLEPEGYVARFESGGGDVGTEHLMCWYCAGTEFDEHAYAALWPLETGKTVEFDRRDIESNRTWFNRIEVLGTERLALPVGEVETYVVRNSSWMRGAGRWYGHAVYWFAPSIGWVVQTEANDIYNSPVRYRVVEVR
ncbi:MAG: hypothetical protein M5U09_01405 [Gammaproteobacteria bacterium]|nr:hypothetical protein [Gammaproteobacteria bacterium]